jgi:hypothetical protein
VVIDVRGFGTHGGRVAGLASGPSGLVGVLVFGPAKGRRLTMGRALGFFQLLAELENFLVFLPQFFACELECSHGLSFFLFPLGLLAQQTFQQPCLLQDDPDELIGLIAQWA